MRLNESKHYFQGDHLLLNGSMLVLETQYIGRLTENYTSNETLIMIPDLRPTILGLIGPYSLGSRMQF